MEKKKLHHKALDASDDIGAFMAALLGMAGIFDVPAKLNITAEELAMALGFGFTILAFLRGRMEKQRRAPIDPALLARIEALRPEEPAAGDSAEETPAETPVDTPEALEAPEAPEPPVVAPPPTVSAPAGAEKSD